MKGDQSEACAKISYPTRGEAKYALKMISKSRGTRGRKVYRCDRCSMWHVGTAGKSRKRQLTKKNEPPRRSA